MAAEFESGVFVREVPWHGLGTIVQDAPNSKEAIKLAELDWNVIQKDVVVSGNVVPNYKANVRDKDNFVLGIVSDRYKIVQNSNAFDFTDSLLDNKDVRYETAGSLKHGKTIWLLAKLPSTNILDDEIAPYLCFTNTHDGTGAVKVFMTPVRVVCNNTLNLALEGAKRTWSARHIGNIDGKLVEAKETLGLAQHYMKVLAEEADVLVNKPISDTQIFSIVKNLFPINDDMSDRQKNNLELNRENLLRCCEAEDIKRFRNTQYGFINAVTDFVGHTSPNRLTSSYQENNWGKIMNGHPIVDKACELLKAI